MHLDCDTCIAQHTRHCETCVVSVILNLDSGAGVLIDASEERALRLLADGGLLPPLRFQARAAPEVGQAG